MALKTLFISISMLIMGSSFAQPDCVPIANLEILDTWQTVSGSYDADGWVIYEVTMDLGVHYIFKTGCGNGASTDHNTIIEWMTPICTVINDADDGCENGASLLSFENGIFGDETVLWIRVRGAMGDGGSFTMAYRSIEGEPGNCNECPAYDQDISATSIWQTISSSYPTGGCKVYRINVDAGTQYTFKTGCGDGATADHDTFLDLMGVSGWPSCNTLSMDDDGCEEGRSSLTWTAASDGFLYLKVRGANGEAGSFDLAYSSSGGNGSICSGCPEHDFFITPTTNWATSTSGHLADGCQIYRVPVLGGWNYTFKTGCGNNATADHDTQLQLYDDQCVLLTSDDNGCDEQLSLLEFEAPDTGFVYLVISGVGGGEGMYTLAYRRSGTCTNCPSFDHALTPADQWQTSSDVFQIYGCRMYQVPVVQGEMYVFQTGCGEGAISDHSSILQIYDEGCALLGTNYDACDGPGSRIYYSAANSGMIYLRVAGQVGQFGEYTLAYRQLDAANDDCSQLVPLSIGPGESITLIGDVENTTSDGDFVAGSEFSGMPVMWHAIQITECTDLIVSYCDQDPVWANGLGSLALECPADSTIAPWADGWACDNGNMNNIFTGLQPGEYMIPVLYDPENAGTQYAIEVSGIWCGMLGIETLPDLDWSIFPTPGSDRFSIRNGTAFEIVSVEILDPSGRVVGSFDRSIQANTYQEFIVGVIPSGVYMVRAELSDRRIMRKHWIAVE